ncbi:hypothetical protein AMATHDRAFT_88672 [Amanita thiersii Skay4041]|uniref:Protein MAK16 n=1 Tax=Amanita thiersii Skay4041 TaxID=703135 RepID=A0A2A9NBW2_9AGAR|nr:hypothetical protein AMATHDRAFT_88672 [Amanita thiersii Skay4041]
MQSDDVIWSVIGHQFCSYKVKSTTQNFCRNEFNVTGFCNRQSCPLANSRYATVRERNGVLYLYVKTIERAYSPARMWERIKLSSNYSTALQQIDNELLHWPNFTIHKCKQRITKITQSLITMRRLKLRQQQKLTGAKKKLDHREAVREHKALAAAHLERSIEKELLARLKSKAYGDAPLNVNEHVWRAILDKEAGYHMDGFDQDAELDMVNDETEEEDLQSEFEGNWGERQFVSDISGDESDSIANVEESVESHSDSGQSEGGGTYVFRTQPRKRKADMSQHVGKKLKSKIKDYYINQLTLRVGGPTVEVEYEEEIEHASISKLSSTNW